MEHSINLTAATQALATQFGVKFTASRLGGERRLAAVLSERFGLPVEEAHVVLNSLVRRRALCWVAERGLPLPCPGVLELCGQWLIQPDGVQER